MVRVGDKIRKKVWLGKCGTGKGEDDTRITGTVIYVHPKGRYYVLKFKTRDGCFCESFVLD